jgi:pimeloyl-ACP methyl ester carboxylesterase
MAGALDSAEKCCYDRNMNDPTDAALRSAASHWASRSAQERYETLLRAAHDDAWTTPPRRLDVAGPFGVTCAFQWAGAGRPIVLLHGAQTSSLMWAPLVHLLAPRPVLAFDTPGDPGMSRPTQPLPDAHALVAWFADTIDALDFDGVHLVGTSYGGWIALHASFARPDLVRSLTLVEPVIVKVRPMFFAHGVASGLVLSVPGPQRRALCRRLDVEALARNPRDRAMGILAFRKHRRSGLPRFTPVPFDAFAELAPPSQLLLGERSPIHHPARVAAALQSANPNLSVEVVAHAGHTLAVEHPDLVAARVGELAARADTPAS